MQCKFFIEKTLLRTLYFKKIFTIFVSTIRPYFNYQKSLCTVEILIDCWTDINHFIEYLTSLRYGFNQWKFERYISLINPFNCGFVVFHIVEVCFFQLCSYWISHIQTNLPETGIEPWLQHPVLRWIAKDQRRYHHTNEPTHNLCRNTCHVQWRGTNITTHNTCLNFHREKTRELDSNKSSMNVKTFSTYYKFVAMWI